NSSRSAGNSTDKDTVTFRIDQYFSERHRLFGRYSFDTSPQLLSPAYGSDFKLSSPTAGPQTFGRQQVVIEDTYTLSPTSVATMRGSYSRTTNFRKPFSDGFDQSSLGLPTSLTSQLLPAFPVVTITGFGNLGQFSYISSAMDTWAGQASLAKTAGKHNLKTGFEYRLMRANMTKVADAAEQFTFSNAWTQGPDPTRATAIGGNALASFLLGMGGGSVAMSPAVAFQSDYWAFYLQDNFKITPKLTLNAGIRYDYESPRTDRFNELTNFDYSAQPPLNAPGMDLHGALSFVGINGASRLQANPDRNNIAPRFGLAYQATPTTVLRAGGGIFFDSFSGIGGAGTAYGISGFSASTSVVASLDGVTPLNRMSNPYPNGLNQPTGSSLGAATLLGQAITFYDRGNQLPYSAQWNFNIQQQLPHSVLLEAGYVGNRGLKYPMDRVLNQLSPDTLGLGDQLRGQVANPFYGQITTGILAQKTVSRAQLLRPYPQFDGVTSTNSNWGSSSYHSLQVKMEKRYASGFSILGAYTYSKMMDIGTGTWAGETLGGGGIQNWYDLGSDWAVSSLDPTHRLVLNPVYEIHLAKGLHGVSKKILDGWEIGSILSAMSGGPLGVGSAVNGTYSQGGGQRPNWTGVSTSISNPTPNGWFDATQFSVAAPYSFGNAPRTFGGTRADGLTELDVTVGKMTPLSDKLKLQFRAEFFNITNTPQFAPPNVSFGSPLFGTVSAQANNPRIAQLALKLIY
ncbi:MAG: TonB-dependent receptor, partial [Acidobacteria bacterium]|nr:TonB-dependent receptor [Acidobacteriota bacterium]